MNTIGRVKGTAVFMDPDFRQDDGSEVRSRPHFVIPDLIRDPGTPACAGSERSVFMGPDFRQDEGL
jgi:hypothetical protein